ncbi:nitrate- and nitrite sensing domain-containing protein [Streptomyces sp. NPDC088725]|uniref:sensor histidine kinase n=1 Tax=Streptomyces sp. NPDC088725 TaxID=3365873 RepID=UPI00381BEDF4
MQGRSKRDSSAAAEQEPRGGSDRGSSPQHTQNAGPAPSGEGGDHTTGSATTGDDRATAPAKPAATGDAGSRIALRNWRISTRLVALLTLPVVAATTLGGLRINDSLNDIQQLEHMQLLTKMTKEATSLAAALQAERDESAGPLTNDSNDADYKVQNRRAQTDRAKKAFLDATVDIGNTDNDEALESIRSNVNQIANQVNKINNIRKDAYKSKDADSLTVDAYSGLIVSLLSLSQDMAQATSNPDMIKRTRALAAFSSAKEYASIQRAVIAAALPADPNKKGHLSDNDRLYGLAASTKEGNALTSFSSLYESMGGDAEDLMAPLNGQGNPEIQSAENYADRVLGKPSGMASERNYSYLDWTDQASTRINAMKTIEATLLGEMESKARELRQQAQRDAIINAALIVLVLGVSLVGAYVVARSMIRSLRRLQDTATKVAQERLPELVKQLSESDPQDVDTSVESVGVHSRDEIGQVATAFDDVHREAVRLAAEQALLRGNVNAMFTNLSRRSQGLIQRQLSLISELESREADPDQLSSLFKLDHLATRMRRNGENLLVLAGEEPGRRWTRPVPLVDVLRAAASEVEQYERIELAAVPATEVAGRVVNDLVHLLAELLENATSFSSPQTKVRVTGHALPDGRVLVEIHDTGIGLSPEDLAAINERLASPPTVDVSVSRRMGLFVVGRLSLRHGIRIQLRPSDSGGTTALVMLPVDVAHGGKKVPGKPGAGIGGPGGAGQPPAVGNRQQGGPGTQNGARAGLDAGTGGPGGSGAPGKTGTGTARAALPARGSAQGGGPQGGPQDGSQPGHAQGGDRQQGFAQAGGRQDQQRQDQQGQGSDQGSIFGQNAFGSQGPGQQNQNRAPGRHQNPNQNQARTDTPGTPADQNGRPGQGQDNRNGQGGRGGQNGFSGRAQNAFQQGGAPQADRGRQLPPPGGPRAELPGGTPQRPQQPQTTSWGADQQPVRQRPSLDAPRGHDEHEPTGQYPMPAAGQDGPGSTSEFQRPDFNGPPPGGMQDTGATAQFPRPDFNAQPDYNAQRNYSGQSGSQSGYGSQPEYNAQADYSNQQGYNAPQDYRAPSDYRAPADYSQGQGSQGQGNQGQGNQGQGVPGNQGNLGNQGYQPQQDFTGQRPQAPGPQQDGFPARRQDTRDNGGYGAQPRQPGLPSPSQPDALPAAGPGDGSTPLFDSLETNWFHGPPSNGQQQGGGQQQPQAPAGPQQSPSSGPAMPQRQTPQRHEPMPQREPVNGSGAGGGAFGMGSESNGPATMSPGATSSWRTSPNDELVRQAERVRKPAAGGITTSGLPRRVPRANLVPGTAQEQNSQPGPQVSRAPADVRGRLTNLRRGIQQGRQAGNTGPANNSFNLGPSHQQER